ncbi:transcriptional regulator AhrC/ArgR [Cytobacillus sp. Hz8]|uniref:transcriptional regulator AhrC/ArgR n=1 Tax=Cytobacillus sp. Hz8 TaxID=3347168 RepID=UPI0035D8DACF
MLKEERQKLIKDIIKKYEVETQDDIVQYLNKAGLTVTQATISRDLRELNLIKIPLNNGKFKYGIPVETHFQPEERLKRVMNDACIKISLVDQFVVIKTIPGNAHAVGVLLDDLSWEEKVGTVCGNDTCLIISATPHEAEIIESRLKQMITLYA